MLVLGIETSTPTSSVALWTREGAAAGLVAGGSRRHVEDLMPAIRTVCDRAGTTLRDVTGIAVGLGPGLFTSMRVGVATAKALAQVLRVPVVGIASLDLLAFGVRFTARAICACIAASRGEVYAAFYRAVPGGVQREGGFGVWTPDALAAEIVARDAETLFVGDGALRHEAELASLAGVEVARGGTQYPRADALCELAIPRLEREEVAPLEQVEPLYVRKTDAEITWEERGVVIERPFRVKVSGR